MMRENSDEAQTCVRGGLEAQHVFAPKCEKQVNERENAMLNADMSKIAKNIADWNTIPKTHQGYVANVYEKGIVNGYDDSTFGADKTVTRAEAATMLVKFKEYISEPGTRR